MFIKDGWYVAAWSTELQGKPLAVEITGEDIVLFRDKSGQVHALEDRCAHRGVPLSRGQVTEHGLVRLPRYHIWSRWWLYPFAAPAIDTQVHVRKVFCSA
jgi:phenylpropionate dioxygenase-like ring-hydroxylating dioxygenase large terminal subunit